MAEQTQHTTTTNIHPQTPIAILGAGPAGLSLARLLEVSHIPYTVFERDTRATADSTAQGGTLDIQSGSGGQEVLRRGGLFEAFQTLARYEGQETRGADGKTGDVFWRIEYQGQQDRPEIGRRELRRLLIESVPEEKIRWGRKVDRVERGEDGTMAVRFADGSAESGFRLVVGADGAWSKARSLIHGAKPVYSGMLQLQYAITPGNVVYEDVCRLCPRGTYIAINGGKSLYVQRQTDASYLVYIARRVEEGWRESEEGNSAIEDAEAFKARLLDDDFKDWDPKFREVIRHAEGFHRVWMLYALPVDSMEWASVPGVTLIGDAAHLSLPSGAGGVNVGMQDALDLAREIIDVGVGEGSDLDGAVKRYEAGMFPRAREHITGGNFIGSVMFAEDSPRGFREWVEWMMRSREGTGGKQGEEA